MTLLMRDGGCDELLYQNAEKVPQRRSLPSPKRLRAGRSNRFQAREAYLVKRRSLARYEIRTAKYESAALLDGLFEHSEV